MIEFQNVNFAYEKDHPVLKDLSFRIEKGEAVGLIGANGAGKSTVMKLLLGLLEGEGKIIVDGVEVRRDTLAQIHRYNHKISGGEKKMAAIATILAMEPDAVLMDEPTSSLDPYNRRIVIHTICGMEQTKLITSHDLDLILDTCSRVILLSGGRIVADGPAQEILNDQALLESHRMELPLSRQG